MAKELQASISLEVKSAEQKLKRLADAINSIERAINQAGSSTTNLENGIQKSIDKTEKLKTEINGVASTQKKVTNQFKQTNEVADSIFNKVKAIAGAYLGVMGTQAMIATSDMITSSENKLNSINNGDTSATQTQMDAMYGAAQRSRTGYADMLANVSKSMTLSPDAFDGSMDKAIAFQEIMGKSYTLGGASAAEQASSMYQMIQALGSGKLAGDELRSVTEGAPLAAKEIEKFAQEVYKTDMALKDMGSKGMITSELVVDAMLKAGNTISDKFEDTSMTFAQAGTMIKNNLTKAFEPVLQKLNQALNALAENGFFDDLARGFAILATILSYVVSFFKLLAENWDWLKMIVIPLTIGIGFLAIALALWATKAKLASVAMKLLGNEAFMAWLKAMLPIALVIAAIVAVIMIFKACGITFAEVSGAIVGAIFTVGAFFKNVWFSFLNIAKGVGAALKVIFQNIGIAFKNVWLECKAKFWDFVGSVYEGVLKIANLINKVLGIFGIQIDTSSLELAVNVAKTKAEENRSKKLEYGDVSSAYAEAASTHDTWQSGWASTAFGNGYDIGEKWGQGVADKISSIGAGLTSDDWGVGNTDYNEMLGDIGDYDAKTAKNTGKMADSMEMAKEDLELLYDLAEMEWKKEFTTANITVDMSNYNTFNDTSDYEGFAIRLKDGLVGELSAVANGTYGF